MCVSVFLFFSSSSLSSLSLLSPLALRFPYPQICGLSTHVTSSSCLRLIKTLEIERVLVSPMKLQSETLKRLSFFPF